jgi:hypothetical protein
MTPLNGSRPLAQVPMTCMYARARARLQHHPPHPNAPHAGARPRGGQCSDPGPPVRGDPCSAAPVVQWVCPARRSAPVPPRAQLIGVEPNDSAHCTNAVNVRLRLPVRHSTSAFLRRNLPMMRKATAVVRVFLIILRKKTDTMRVMTLILRRKNGEVRRRSINVRKSSDSMRMSVNGLRRITAN